MRAGRAVRQGRYEVVAPIEIILSRTSEYASRTRRKQLRRTTGGIGAGEEAGSSDGATALQATAVAFQHALRRRRISFELRRRADRARYKIAAAVRADAVEDRVGTVGAERALEGANARVGGMRRQIAIATFAVRSNSEHLSSPEKPRRLPRQRTASRQHRQKHAVAQDMTSVSAPCCVAR